MEAEYVHAVKLAGASNWKVWKFQVKIVLAAKELLEVVQGEEMEPVQTAGETPVAFETRRKAWKKKDTKAQEILVMRMEETPTSHLLTCQNAHQMWNKLLSVYEQKSTVSVHLLQQKFFQMKCEKKGISEFVSKKTEETTSQLKLVVVEISQSMVVTKILMSLPDEYKHFVFAWDLVTEEKQSVNELLSQLLIEEERSKTKEESNDDNCALSAKRKGEQKKKCSICGKGGHTQKECYYKNKEGKGSKFCLLLSEARTHTEELQKKNTRKRR